MMSSGFEVEPLQIFGLQTRKMLLDGGPSPSGDKDLVWTQLPHPALLCFSDWLSFVY